MSSNSPFERRYGGQKIETSKFLKMSFLIDGLVTLVYGLFLLLLPDIHNSFFGFPYEEFASRYIGALFLGFAIGNLLAYQHQHDKVLSSLFT